MRTREFLVLGVLLAGVSCSSGADTTTTLVTGDATTLAEQPEVTTTVEATTTSAAGEATAGPDTCVLVPAGTVASIFSAASASGEPGIARNCTFTLVDGLVPTVEVFHYGPSTDWDGVMAGFEENRGGVTEVPDVGDEAFQPNDVGLTRSLSDISTSSTRSRCRAVPVVPRWRRPSWSWQPPSPAADPDSLFP